MPVEQDENLAKPPEIPTLMVPSIIPTVPQISLLLDEPDNNSPPPLTREQYNNTSHTDIFNGSEARKFRAWRSETEYKLPSFQRHCQSDAPLSNIHTSVDPRREFFSEVPSMKSGLAEQRKDIETNVLSILNELREDLKVIKQNYQDIKLELQGQSREKGQPFDFQHEILNEVYKRLDPMTELVKDVKTLKLNVHKERINKETQTACIKISEKCVQTSVECRDGNTQTDIRSYSNRPLPDLPSDSASDSDGCEEYVPPPQRQYGRQLQMAPCGPEEYLLERNLNRNRKAAAHKNQFQRHHEVAVAESHRQIPVANTRYGILDSRGRTEVSLATDALLQKYYPQDVITPPPPFQRGHYLREEITNISPRGMGSRITRDAKTGKQFAVVNMSVAMGYQQAQSDQNYRYIRGHPDQDYNSPRRLHVDDDQLIDPRSPDAFEPYHVPPRQRYFEQHSDDYHGDQGEDQLPQNDRWLDLTLIRNQPKLL